MLTGQILLQFIVILIAVQFFGYLCQRIGQQWVIGEILAGLALGPSLFGFILPGIQAFVFPASSLATLQTLGDLGLILYMFSLGAHLDTHLLLRQSRTAVIISLGGILLPLLLGMVLAFFLFPNQAGQKATQISFMLLVGTAMAITAFPVLARLLSERGIAGTKRGTLALTSAAVGDVVAWCLLALVIAVVHAQGLFAETSLVGLVLLFLIGMFTVVRPLLAYAGQHIHSKQILICISMVLLIGSAYVTNAIGIHPIFGAFLMGIILPRRILFIELARNIDQVNTVLFLPLYFVYSGLHMQIGLIHTLWLWLLCLLIVAIACGGKILGVTIPLRFMGKSWHDSFSLGVLMNTRGLVELIVLNIGLELGVLSPTLFSMLVLMALVTTMMASPLLSLLGYKQKIQATNDQSPGSQSLQKQAP